jgi:hypothetical protein
MDAKTQLAERQLKVYQLYTDHQDRLAKAATSKNENSVVETLNINGQSRKVLLDKNTGNVIKDLGPDVSDSKYQLTEYMGRPAVFNPANKSYEFLSVGNGNPKFENEQKDKYASNEVVKGFNTVDAALRRMKNVLSSPSSGVKDIALVYDLIKGLDPTSVVREAEVSLAQSATSAFDKLGITIANLTSGAKLNNNVRQQILDTMEQFHRAAKDSVTNVQAGYVKRALNPAVGANPANIIDGPIFVRYSGGDSWLGSDDIDSAIDLQLQ